MPSDPVVDALQEWIDVSMRNSMRHFIHYARESGLSMSHFGAMFHILRQGSCGVTDLGDHLGVSSAASSQLLDRLVQQDFIVRSEDPRDRRVRQIALTEKGRHVLEEGIHSREEWVKQLADSFTPAEKERVLAGLKLLTEHIKQLSTPMTAKV